jgi:hypothetical protein
VKLFLQCFYNLKRLYKCEVLQLSVIAFHEGGQSATKPHHGRGSKRSGLVREAVISEQNGVSADSDLSTSFMTNSLGG